LKVVGVPAPALECGLEVLEDRRNVARLTLIVVSPAALLALAEV
jgi:hypothetical protein